MPNELRFYLAEKDSRPIGVFSSPEKAASAAYDTLTEITPAAWEGSPVYEKYIFMAKGCCAVPNPDGSLFDIDYTALPPVWGVNPQLALLALCGASDGTDVLVSGLYLFEINRVYAADEPHSIHESDAFSRFVGRTYSVESFNEHTLPQILKRDYLRIYFDEQRRIYAHDTEAPLPDFLPEDDTDEEIDEEIDSEDIPAIASDDECDAVRQRHSLSDMLSRRVMQIACDRIRARGRRISCGFGIARSRELLEKCLYHRFTLQELRQLCALLRLREPTDEVSMLTGDAACELLERVKEYIPPIYSSRPLKDFLD